ncbi:26S proteasome non-ATPase regulatory subunit 9 isoform X2 [Clupea harengus]|uniref:26S proteasome non-ATPase regulatory subunit 9 n=1 Tax=Clupea harengus TaxID=7950 RepID=A0A6P8FU62_CLUHA|nr:26S proteasome non-ATPase regulatory subunit 9 isoform X2 [Clupea harengus]
MQLILVCPLRLPVVLFTSLDMKMSEEYREKSTITAEDVQNLIKKKDEIEEQIKAYYDVLEDQGVGAEGPLVDIEGFPRADLDLYQVRTARNSISCLQNDHTSLMLEIEEALHQLHAHERAKRERDQQEAVEEGMEQESPLPPAFARVDHVTQGSPASQAGLRVEDEIIEFGSVNPGNFQNLQNIASVVQHSEGALSVAVVRNGQRVQMNLVPQRWSGRGLLGCNIQPLHR